MNSLTDQQLLRDYVERRSEAAFAELARRQVDLVYSAALRMVRDAHLAEDVTQSVFVALSKNADQLTDRPVLSGWLHRTTQNLAANVVRTEVRRRAREQEAVAMNELLTHETDAAWENIAPFLDTALGELSEPDRDALLLRYFEHKSAREMAQTLNVSEEAAQKRVNRAVERLRELFSKRNVTIGTSGLAVLISTNAVQAAPLSLIAMVSSAVTATTITLTTHTTMQWINLKSVAAILTAAITAGTGTHLLQQREANQLRSENQNLLAHQKQLATERDTALSATSQKSDDVEQLRKERSELLRLRGEVGVLRRQITEFDKFQENNGHTRTGIATAQNPNAISAETDLSAQITTNTINAMKQIGLAMKLYALNHDHVFPTNFDQIMHELPPRFGNIELDAFEFVSHAAPINERKHPDKIVARERTARQTPQGKWARVYGFASGRVVEQVADDGNFETWEKQQMILTP